MIFKHRLHVGRVRFFVDGALEGVHVEVLAEGDESLIHMPLQFLEFLFEFIVENLARFADVDVQILLDEVDREVVGEVGAGDLIIANNINQVLVSFCVDILSGK